MKHFKQILFSVLFVILLSNAGWGQTQIFLQDFSSSSTLSDYINSSSPSSGQWNAIGTSGAGTVISITSNKLSFARTGNAGSFSRTTNFLISATIPTALIYKVNIQVSGNTSATTSAAVFQVGSGFGTANSAEANANTYARFAINFTATDGTFQIRDITNSVNSSDLTGAQTITWVLNNSGVSVTYLAPDGSSESVANDVADIWANTTKLFNDVAVQTIAQNLSDLKFAFTAGTGTIIMDNFDIKASIDGTLPVNLQSFNANVSGNNVKLKWNTLEEINNAGFFIERINNEELIINKWKSLGFIEGHGTKNTPTSYSFEDKNLNTGKYKYRLKQVDHNGNYEYFELQGEVEVGVPKKFDISQNYPNPFNPVTKINFDLPENGLVNIRLYDMLGREVAVIVNEVRNAGYHTVQFDASKLSSGIYFYKMSAGKFSGVKKMSLIK